MALNQSPTFSAVLPSAERSTDCRKLTPIGGLGLIWPLSFEMKSRTCSFYGARNLNLVEPYIRAIGFEVRFHFVQHALIEGGSTDRGKQATRNN
jgi:hypothetical protein